MPVRECDSDRLKAVAPGMKEGLMPKKYFTYNINVSFEMQFTFSESEVEQSDEGLEGSMSPTDEALEALGKEIREYLSQNYCIDKTEAMADFDDLLGVEERNDRRTSPESSDNPRSRVHLLTAVWSA